MSTRLSALLCSPDPAVQAQGVELTRALGDAGIEALLAGCEITDDGRLWRRDGLSAAMVSLMAEALPPIQHLHLTAVPDPNLLRQLPTLESLHLSATTLPDLGVLHALPRLTNLTLHTCALGNLPALSDLSGLRALRIEHCSVSRSEPIPRLPPLHTFKLEGIPLLDRDAVLPQSLRDLQLTAGYVFWELSGLSLTRFRGSMRTAERLSDPGALEHLEVYSAPPDGIAHLPITRLYLSRDEDVPLDLAPLRDQHRLQWLDLGYQHSKAPPLDLAPLCGFPALEVVGCDGDGPPLPDHLIACPRTTRMQQYRRPGAKPMVTDAAIARSAAWWVARGHRYAVRVPSPPAEIIPVIKGFRRHIRLGLRECLALVKLAAGAGLAPLTLEEAIEVQGALCAAGVQAVVEDARSSRSPPQR